MIDPQNMVVDIGDIPAEEIKNPNLKSAIAKIHENETERNIDLMVNEVVKAKFILPVKMIQGKSENETQISFRLLENSNNQKFFGAFTDVEELKKWDGNEELENIIVDFDSLANMLLNSDGNVLGVVINAFGKSIEMPDSMVIMIKQQCDYLKLYKDEIKLNSEVKFFEPEKYPVEMMAMLMTHFETAMPYVNSVFVRMFEQDGQKGCLLIVDFIGDVESDFKEIYDVAFPFLKNAKKLVIMPLAMSFAGNAVKDIEPFYVAKN